MSPTPNASSKAFVARAEQRQDTADLLTQIGKNDDSAAKHAQEVQIVRLRKKLRLVGAPAPFIKSMRAYGYQLCIPLQIDQFS